MSLEPATAFAPHDAHGGGRAWQVLTAAARTSDARGPDDRPGTFGLSPDGGTLVPIADNHPDAVLRWHPGQGWTRSDPASAAHLAWMDLYLPLCSANAARPMTVGHLGQSLDGFIATQSGDSQFVTGPENIRHLHRMRALSHAVVVGAGTVVADNPQLNTRHVPGPNPLRVVIDPTRRLTAEHRVFRDGLAETVYACAHARLAPGETHLGNATIVGLADGPSGIDLSGLLAHLRARGCSRVFVEGGGVTVSAFLQAGLIERLQVAVAPFVIGNGRPAIRLPGPEVLRDCPRPRARVFRMGTDVLFDCDFTRTDDAAPQESWDPPIARVL